MADVNLTNLVSISGEYGDPATPISSSSNTVTTTIVQGLTVTKSADKTNWVDGPLTYTMIIQNDSGSALSSGVLTDDLDATLVDFNTTYGVQINGSVTSDFTYTDGQLKVNLPDLATGNSTTVTFQVTRKS